MPPLSSDERHELLARARQAITEAVLHDRLADLPPAPPNLAQPAAAFVTVYCWNRLRGCIGQMARDLPLAETVAQCAVSAALQDLRFPPLTKNDMPGLRIEISVLSELEPASEAAVEAGRHGVLVVRDAQRGLLLPQVATEHHWSARRLVEETCIKAGLDKDAWRDPATKLFVFTAEVFSDGGIADACAQSG
jgi:AmmeMemoRadiSam system protein A